MTRENVIAIKRNRLNTLMQNGKNSDCPGVVKKLQRELRNLEK